MLWVIQFTLCSVSMILTALFALSFSTDSLGLPFSVPGEAIIAPVLMVIVGLSLDAIKYLFWGSGVFHYQLSSLVLVFFSWAASVAFFVTQDDAKVERARIQSPEYHAYLAEKSGLERQIEQKTALVELKSSSQFHKQWKESERLSNEVGELSDRLNRVLLTGQTIGLDQAKSQLTSSAFFDGLGNAIQESGDTVRNAFFAILALLLELGSIGVISLRRKIKLITQQSQKSSITDKPFQNKTQEDVLGFLSKKLPLSSGYADIPEKSVTDSKQSLNQSQSYAHFSQSSEKPKDQYTRGYLRTGSISDEEPRDSNQRSDHEKDEFEQAWKEFEKQNLHSWDGIIMQLPPPLPLTRSDVLSCRYVHHDEKKQNQVFKWMGKISHPISRFRKAGIQS